MKAESSGYDACMSIALHDLRKIIDASLAGIRDMLDDPAVTEIMVTADGCVFVESRGEIEKTSVTLSEPARLMCLKAVAKAESSKDLQSGTQSAVVSASVGGLRFAGAIMGVDSRGTTITIRKHRPIESRFTLEQLVDVQMLSQEQANLLEKFLVYERLNTVFAGPTSGGKTTLANALCMRIPLHERIGLIEDAREMEIPHENKECMLTNVQGGLSAAVLIKHALRSRFDRLILSETRGDETFDLLRALSSGHPGSVTTVHSSDGRGALTAIELLLQMSLPSGVQMSVASAQRYIASCIHMIVFCERKYITGSDGIQASRRRVTEILHITGVKDDDYIIEKIG